MGPIPAVLGAVKFRSASGGHIAPGIKVVAIVSEDNSPDKPADAVPHKSALALMVAKKDYDRIAADPASTLPKQKFLMTPASLAEMYERQCLAAWNLTLDSSHIIAGQQADIRTALRAYASGTPADYSGIAPAGTAFVWASFTYLAEDDAAKAKALSCPSTTNFDAPSFIVARSDLLNELDAARLDANRKQIADFVAKYLGAWAKAKSKPQDAAKRLVETHSAEGIKVSEAQAQAELEARQPPDLAGQRAAFTPTAGGVIPLAMSLDVIMDFMVSTGTLKTGDRPAAGELLDGSILEFINSDPNLKAIANGTQ
jgi:hypothetical protein